MHVGLIHQIQLIFVLLLIFIIGFGALAERLKVPYPIVLVIAGLLLSFIPRLPAMSLNPDFIFLGVLPPLLFASGAETSWRDFQYNLVSILFLAFGLVGFTVLGISFAAHWLIPGFDWRLGLVLGAAVAPTDAIAATAIAKHIGLPQRIIDVLEGESLVNDASGLLALQFSIAFIVTGYVPSVAEGVWQLLYLVAGGIAIGLIMGKLVSFVSSHLDNAPIEIAVTIATPYVAYMSAEAAHSSGVLAVVVAGLYLGRQTSQLFSSNVRIQAQSFWNTLTFLLNGIVFLLIGLELPHILAGIRSISVGELITSAAELAASIILLRLIWTFPGAYVSYFVRRRFLHQPDSLPPLRAIFVVGWTGMRGVVSLAAALSVPITLANGRPFPQRSALIFLTFAVILVTLVLQGFTLPTLIRSLHLNRSEDKDPEEYKARRNMLRAVLNHLEQLRSSQGPELASLYDSFAQVYSRRLASVQEGEEGEPESSRVDRARYLHLATELRDVERSTIIGMRDRKEIGDSVLHILERELDLLDVRFAQNGFQS